MISDSSSSDSLSGIMLYSWRIYVEWKGIYLTHMCNAHTLFISPQTQGPVMLITSLRASERFVFIYFLVVRGLPCWTVFLQLQRVGATLHRGTWASLCSCFSCCGTQALGTWASVVVGCKLSSFGPWALDALWHVESSWTRD